MTWSCRHIVHTQGNNCNKKWLANIKTKILTEKYISLSKQGSTQWISKQMCLKYWFWCPEIGSQEALKNGWRTCVNSLMHHPWDNVVIQNHQLQQLPASLLEHSKICIKSEIKSLNMSYSSLFLFKLLVSKTNKRL